MAWWQQARHSTCSRLLQNILRKFWFPKWWQATHSRNWKTLSCGKRVTGITYIILGSPCAPSQLFGDTWDIRIFVKWGLLPNHQGGPARFACTALKFSKKRRTNFITRTRAGRWFRPPSCLNQKRERLLRWAWLSAAFTTLAQPLMKKSSPQSYMHSTPKSTQLGTSCVESFLSSALG